MPGTPIPSTDTPTSSAAADSGRADAQPASKLPAESVEQFDADYVLAQEEVGRVLDAAAVGQRFEVGVLQRLVADMASSVETEDTLLVQALNDDETGFNLSRHLVNTAVFAIKIGQGAGCRSQELSWLGLAGCLHDVGMVFIPKPILDKPGPLSSDEMALVRQHPEHGFRILQRLGTEFEWLANVALQEHEREDRTGYPKGLGGGEIHEYAKIVGLADAYESLTHRRPYRTQRTAFDAVKDLITVQRQKFPDRALKGLIHGLSTFPVGSHVRLNSMEVARIVATNSAFPLRPVIEVVVGPKGERLTPPRRVDLSTNTLLYVTEACSGTLLT